MRMVDIIAKKRDGGVLSEQEIRFLIEGYTNGGIPDYQMSAWAMAVLFRGMTAEETAILTDAMMRSGDTVDLSCFGGLWRRWAARWQKCRAVAWATPAVLWISWKPFPGSARP